MERKITLILGSIFIVTSGLIYTIERIISMVHWSALTRTGEYPTNPLSPSLLDNLFIPIFLLIGIIFIYVSFKKEINKVLFSIPTKH
ncbi:hypothetical protein K0H71_16725 [Bacillus sp. IITD106]|nr:hypothetical protein [Bacillus sp. IITD106]